MTSGRRRLADRLRHAAKWCAVIVLLGAATIGGLYAAAPSIATRAAPYFAERFGLTQLDLTMRRPDRRGVVIERIVVASDSFRLHGADVRVDISWSALRAKRIDRIVARTLDVAVISTDDDSETGPATDSLIPRVPVDLISIQSLTLRFADTGFIGTGKAELGQAGLSVSLAGQHPEAASRLMLDASLTREGVFDVLLRERGHDDAPPFLALDGTLAGSRLNVTGHADLGGFPLQLISSLAGLPAGDGRVTANMRTQLPWPLPDNLSWQEQEADVPAYSVDWRSADGLLGVRLEDGRAELRGGAIVTRVGGELTLRADDRTFLATLPAGYALSFADQVVSGGAGLTAGTSGPDLDATVYVDSWRLETGATTRLQVTGDLTELERSGRRIDVSRRTEAATKRMTLSATAARDGNFSLHLGERGDDKPASWFSVDGALKNDALSLSSTTDLRGYPLQLVRDLAGLPAGDGRVTAQLQTQLPWPLPTPAGWRELDADMAAFAVRWESDDGAVALRLNNGAAALRKGTLTANVGGQMTLRAQDQVVRLTLPPRYRVTFAGQTLSGGAGPVINASMIDIDALVDVRSLKLSSDDPIRLSLNANVDGKTSQARARGRIDARLTVLDTQSRRARGTLSFDGNVVAAQQDQRTQVRSTLRLDGDRLQADGSADYGQIRDVRYEFSHDLDAGTGTAHASAQLSFVNPVASQMIAGWDKPFDLDRANIDAQVSLDWNKDQPMAATATLNVTDGAAHYDDYLMAGIAGQLRLSSNDVARPGAWQLAPTRVDIGRIDVGMPVTNAFVQAAFSNDTLSVSASGATLLGGIALTSPFDYDLATSDATFDLQLENIDLGRVLALEGDDISGEGLLDGVLPVRIRDNKVSISQGRLQARPPGGTIRLKPSLSQVGGQNELSFALKALADFHYNKLDTQVDYAENGDMTLGVRLQGRNPGVEKNRPIHYNLNISENVPVLLESLRLKDKFTERIEKKINK